ncbi:MAG: ATP-binding protein [Sneathiellales bacterium]|nr:ATP-binding protein [Sneathiellales bacterium]
MSLKNKSLLDLEYLPLVVFLSTFVMTLFGLIWIVWSIYSVGIRDETSHSEWVLEVSHLQGEIIHLDEVLTMSARMAAQTGDAIWEQRYRKYEPELGKAIEAASALVPETHANESVLATNSANEILVEIEEKAFSHVREGNVLEASELLSSPLYENNKRIYARGMEVFNQVLQEALANADQQRLKSQYLQILLASAIAIILLFSWGCAFILLKRWRLRLTEAKKEAEKASRAKSSFLATISHEIRTPLNGILGTAQLMAETRLEKDQREHLRILQNSGQVLLAIINDVLDMSKIDAGRMEIEKTAFKLSNCLTSSTDALRSLAKQKGLKLNMLLDPEVPDYVKGDPVKLRQILWNLLSNAIKFTEIGHVTVGVSVKEPKRDGKIWLVIYVEDTGAGIRPDRLATIFEAFSQEDETITRRHGGTGLGLAIVKNLVALLQGEISVKSEKGHGTRFDLRLPFHPVPASEIPLEETAPTTPIKSGSRPLNILVAEDNEVNAMIIRAFLEKAGHSVLLVDNGKKAVQAVAEKQPDLLITDIHMPVMDGEEATRRIRQMPMGKNLRIIGLTAEAFADRHRRFLEAGMDDILSKPYTEDQLTGMIYRNVEHQ